MKLTTNKANNPPFLSLDLGDRFIGMAYSEARILVSELQTIDRRGKSDDQIFRQLAEIIEKNQIKSLVVGLPISSDRSENDHCQKIRNFVNDFEKSLDPTYYLLPTTYFFPEDFSSIDASLLPKSKLNQKPKISSHSQAAKIILERFLENI